MSKLEDILKGFMDPYIATLPEAQKALDEAAQQILDLCLECVPDNRNGEVDPQTGAPVGMQGCVDHGYDQALSEARKRLKEALGGK